MREQITDGDRPFGGTRLVAGVGLVELRDDDRVPVLRQELCHVVVQRQFPFVHEHHDGDRRDRLVIDAMLKIVPFVMARLVSVLLKPNASW